MKPLQYLPPITGDLQPGAVDLWCFFYESLWEPHRESAYQSLMSADEWTRYRRFVFERDQIMFLATRALVRTALSNYVDVAPADWQFAKGSHGKPFIAGPTGHTQLFFNLTNTRGLIVCAVSRDYPQLGVDAESMDRTGETIGLANRYFSMIEVQALRALPTHRQHQRFFEYWTLKESYIKARGLGLSVPLDKFSILLDDESAIKIKFDNMLTDEAGSWRFDLRSASPDYLVALGVNTGGAPLVLSATNYVPLQGARPFSGEPV